MLRPPPLYALTSLRFFAAASIVALHTGISADSRLGLGVGFFFVLSGFILTYVYRDFTGHSISAFYLSRFARLWPVHAVTFLFAAIVLQPNALTNPIYLMTAPLNLLLLQAWFPIQGLVFSWNGPSWSISAELWFYILLPFLAASRRLWIWGLALCAIAAVIVLTFPPRPPGPFTFSYVHAIMQHPAVRVVEFLAGVTAGRAYNAGLRLKGGTLLELAAIALAVIYVVTSPLVQNSLSVAGFTKAAIWYDQSGGFAVFAFAIFVFAQNTGIVSRLLAWPVLVKLGEISFSTYMLHMLIIRFNMKYQIFYFMGWNLKTAVLIVIIYAGSYLLWEYVEKPARKSIIRAG